MTRLITLWTDFGLSDPFVGVMKGVIVKRFPAAEIVDATHQLPPQDVSAAAFWLSVAYPYFPSGTVHVTVIDPTVGTSRPAVVVESAGHMFVAPDNGLLSALPGGIDRCHRIDEDRLLGTNRSRTFHGRDVFAPIAADLASGALGIEEVGPPSSLEEASALPKAEQHGDTVTGAVVVTDHFGNLLSNIEARWCEAAAQVRLSVQDREIPLGQTYASVASGELVALINAWGMLEIAVRDGDAARRLGAGPGTVVKLRLCDE